MKNLVRKFQTIIEVGHKTQTLHFYHEERHISHSEQERHIGLIEYHLEDKAIKIDLIFVHQYLEGYKFGSNMLQYFIENVALKLHLPITGICISEASIHLFYNMKKRYPTIIRNMQISYEKCVCHYCKNQIKFLDQLDITDLYYYHKKGKCPSRQSESLSLGFHNEQKRFKSGEARSNGRRSHTRNANQRDRGHNISMKLEYRDSEYSEDSRWNRKERILRRKEVSEKRNSHYKEKHPRFRKISAEEYSQLLLQQLGY